MSRKRKPVRKPIAAAAECLYWRATVLLEAISAATQLDEPIKRLAESLADYDVSRGADAITMYLCAGCSGPCTERRNGLCNRCFDAQVPTAPKLMFAEMQS